MEAVKYVVCFQNRYPPTDDEYFAGRAEHGSAFVLATIAGLAEPTPERMARSDYKGESGRRFLVRFGEYAPINRPNAWQHWRNPVIYGSLGSLSIDPAKEALRPMPDASSARPANIAASHPTPTVASLRDQLRTAAALALGVPAGQVEVLIRL